MRAFIEYGWVALGGAVGSVARHGVSALLSRRFGDAFPIGTLAVNVAGSFLIGLLFVLTFPDGHLDHPRTRPLLITGVLGGFTTFSAFSLQTLTLLQQRHWFAAAANVLGSVALCLAAAWLGWRAGHAMNP